MTSNDSNNLPTVPSWLVEAAKNANLPTLLLGPAGAALSRLVGGATDIPAAWLQAKADEIKATSEARRSVKLALAGAAGVQAISRDELVEQALLSMLPDHIRKQINKENIARRVVDELEDVGAAGGETLSEPDADWMNMFVRFAEDASSDRMRELWARVLSKEIVRNGSFSLRTVRFLSEIDAMTAEAFERVAARHFGESGVDIPKNMPNDTFGDVLLLQQNGLLSYDGGDLGLLISLSDEGIDTLDVRENALVLHGAAGAAIQYQCCIMTPIGSEVIKILDLPQSRSVAIDIASRMPKTGLTKIEIVSPDQSEPETLWIKPND